MPSNDATIENSPLETGQQTFEKLKEFSEKIKNLDTEGKLASKDTFSFTLTGDGKIQMIYPRIDGQPNEELVLTVEEMQEALQYVQQ
jgi:hypothetical protein